MSEYVDADGVIHEEENSLSVVQPREVSTLDRSEVEMQVDAAHKYPRSVRKFLADAISLATLDEDTAASCIFSYRRGGKVITGPSIRCAEICISAWGNAHVGSRIVAVEEKEIVAQGGAWDLEKNVKCTVETRRRITGKDGERYNDDMIAITGNAAASIAIRNAIFKIVPRAYVNAVYSAARKASVGNASTLSERRAKVMERLAKMGATVDRVLAAVGKPSVDDLGVDDVEALIGYGTAIKSGEQRLDDVFPEVKAPPPDAAPEARRMSMRRPKEAPPAADAAPPEPGSSG
jgi:hypothetical protein